MSYYYIFFVDNELKMSHHIQRSSPKKLKGKSGSKRPRTRRVRRSKRRSISSRRRIYRNSHFYDVTTLNNIQIQSDSTRDTHFYAFETYLPKHHSQVFYNVDNTKFYITYIPSVKTIKKNYVLTNDRGVYFDKVTIQPSDITVQVHDKLFVYSAKPLEYSEWIVNIVATFYIGTYSKVHISKNDGNYYASFQPGGIERVIQVRLYEFESIYLTNVKGFKFVTYIPNVVDSNDKTAVTRDRTQSIPDGSLTKHHYFNLFVLSKERLPPPSDLTPSQ